MVARKMAAFLLTVAVLLTGLLPVTILAAESRDTLKSKLEHCLSLNKDFYQPKTWSAMEKAISEAKPYIDEKYGTDEQASDKLVMLNDALVGLKKLANRDAINAAIGNIGYLKEAEFKKESWAEFLKAVASVKSAQADKNSSQTTIDAKQSSLVLAMSKLVKIDGSTCPDYVNKSQTVDKAVLNAAVYNVGYLNRLMFLESSYEIFAITVDVAVEVLNDSDASQLKVNQIQMDLSIAMLNLEFDPYMTSGSNERTDFPEELRLQEASSEESLISSEEPVSSDSTKKPTKKTTKKNIDKVSDDSFPVYLIIIIATSVFVLLCTAVIVLLVLRRKKLKKNTTEEAEGREFNEVE